MPTPNEAMRKEARRGLDWRSEYGRGGTAVGIARGRDISNGENLSMDTVRRMASYFSRHEVDKKAEGFRPGEDNYPSNGRIAWALWGGDAGRSWANKQISDDEGRASLIRVVVGPPCAGKSTFVDDNRQSGDVVVDYDKIAVALGSDEFHKATGDVRAAAFTARSSVIDSALSGKIKRAWIIHTKPMPDMVDKYREAGFDFEIVNPGREECLSRAEADGRPSHTIEAIEKWFSEPFDVNSLNDKGAQRQMESKMSERETRAAAQPMEIREDQDNAIRVSGYAAVFGEETNIAGLFTEVIDRGAFTNALQRQDDVVFLVNHDGLPLARTRSGTLKLTEDDRGLYMETELDGTDPDVRAIVPKMKRGDLDKMSFAFVPKRQEWDDSGSIPKRTIQDLELHDVAIVTTPAYDGTEIGLRSLEAHRAQATKSQAARRLRMKGKL